MSNPCNSLVAYATISFRTETPTDVFVAFINGILSAASLIFLSCSSEWPVVAINKGTFFSIADSNTSSNKLKWEKSIIPSYSISVFFRVT